MCIAYVLPLARRPKQNRQKPFQQDFGSVARGIVQDTIDVLFRDLWLNPELHTARLRWSETGPTASALIIRRLWVRSSNMPMSIVHDEPSSDYFELAGAA